MPLRADDLRFLPQLNRYRSAGVDVVSLNVGFDGTPWENTLRVLEFFRRWINERSDEYVLIESLDDVDAAQAHGKLGVCFDIEGGGALNGRLDLIEQYYRRGVRWMSIAYNKNNILGGGCLDNDPGLSRYGREVVLEMQRVGMVVCCSHTGYRTSMDVLDCARGPIIFSHSNPLAMCAHPRNITDELIQRCAARGGVVGINGLGPFLNTTGSITTAMARHIDYVIRLVGVEHVGLALDYVFDEEEFSAYMRDNPDMFPESAYGTGLQRCVNPEQIADVMDDLVHLGYSDDDLCAILGQNHRRVAQNVWK